MVAFKKCFVMLCTNFTEQECLWRGLFGDRRWRFDYLREIVPGDIGFLLNMTKNELIGVFVARSAPELDIEADAWRGEFPAQIRVEPIGEITRLRDADVALASAGVILDAVPSGRLVPMLPIQSPEIGLHLLKAFGQE